MPNDKSKLQTEKSSQIRNRSYVTRVPLDTDRFNAADSSKGKEFFIIEPNYDENFVHEQSDLTIFVDLEVVHLRDIKGQNLLLSDENNFKISNSYVFPNREIVDGQVKGGQLDTSFSELDGFSDPGKKRSEYQGFGIKDINISFKGSNFPLVGIKFEDIRGGTMFNLKDRSKELENKFRAFFVQPYGVFKLTIKGFYGSPVELCLYLKDWNATFRAETGSYEIDAEFLGYEFAFLNDITMEHVLANTKAIETEQAGSLEALTKEDTKCISSCRNIKLEEGTTQTVVDSERFQKLSNVGLDELINFFENLSNSIKVEEAKAESSIDKNENNKLNKLKGPAKRLNFLDNVTKVNSIKKQFAEIDDDGKTIDVVDDSNNKFIGFINNETNKKIFTYERIGLLENYIVDLNNKLTETTTDFESLNSTNNILSEEDSEIKKVSTSSLTNNLVDGITPINNRYSNISMLHVILSYVYLTKDLPGAYTGNIGDLPLGTLKIPESDNQQFSKFNDNLTKIRLLLGITEGTTSTVSSIFKTKLSDNYFFRLYILEGAEKFKELDSLDPLLFSSAFSIDGLEYFHAIIKDAKNKIKLTDEEFKDLVSKYYNSPIFTKKENNGLNLEVFYNVTSDNKLYVYDVNSLFDSYTKKTEGLNNSKQERIKETKKRLHKITDNILENGIPGYSGKIDETTYIISNNIHAYLKTLVKLGNDVFDLIEKGSGLRKNVLEQQKTILGDKDYFDRPFVKVYKKGNLDKSDTAVEGSSKGDNEIVQISYDELKETTFPDVSDEEFDAEFPERVFIKNLIKHLLKFNAERDEDTSKTKKAIENIKKSADKEINKTNNKGKGKEVFRYHQFLDNSEFFYTTDLDIVNEKDSEASAQLLANVFYRLINFLLFYVDTKSTLGYNINGVENNNEDTINKFSFSLLLDANGKEEVVNFLKDNITPFRHVDSGTTPISENIKLFIDKEIQSMLEFFNLKKEDLKSNSLGQDKSNRRDLIVSVINALTSVFSDNSTFIELLNSYFSASDVYALNKNNLVKVEPRSNVSNIIITKTNGRNEAQGGKEFLDFKKESAVKSTFYSEINAKTASKGGGSVISNYISFDGEAFAEELVPSGLSPDNNILKFNEFESKENTVSISIGSTFVKNNYTNLEYSDNGIKVKQTIDSDSQLFSALLNNYSYFWTTKEEYGKRIGDNSRGDGYERIPKVLLQTARNVPAIYKTNVSEMLFLSLTLSSVKTFKHNIFKVKKTVSGKPIFELVDTNINDYINRFKPLLKPTILDNDVDFNGKKIKSVLLTDLLFVKLDKESYERGDIQIDTNNSEVINSADAKSYEILFINDIYGSKDFSKFNTSPYIIDFKNKKVDVNENLNSKKLSGIVINEAGNYYALEFVTYTLGLPNIPYDKINRDTYVNSDTRANFIVYSTTDIFLPAFTNKKEDSGILLDYLSVFSNADITRKGILELILTLPYLTGTDFYSTYTLSKFGSGEAFSIDDTFIDNLKKTVSDDVITIKKTLTGGDINEALEKFSKKLNKTYYFNVLGPVMSTPNDAIKLLTNFGNENNNVRDIVFKELTKLEYKQENSQNNKIIEEAAKTEDPDSKPADEKDEIENSLTEQEGIDKNLITSMSNTISNLYEKWLTGLKNVSALNSDGLAFYNICGLENSPCHFFGNFDFINARGRYIGDISSVNPNSIGLVGSGNISALSYLNTLMSDSNFLTLNVPIRNPENIEETLFMFEPQPYFTRSRLKSGNSLVFIYANANSKKANINGNTDLGEGVNGEKIDKNDSYNMLEVLTPISGEKAEPFDLSNIELFNRSSEKAINCSSNNILGFCVSYSRQNQGIFKSVSMSQKQFRETDRSLIALSNFVNNQGKVVKINPDFFNLFEVRSYEVEVEMMGNAQIQPLQYFQLNNVPMFNGTYLILDVEHNITANNMTTKFKGSRQSKYLIPEVDKFYTISDYIANLDTFNEDDGEGNGEGDIGSEDSSGGGFGANSGNDGVSPELDAFKEPLCLDSIDSVRETANAPNGDVISYNMFRSQNNGNTKNNVIRVEDEELNKLEPYKDSSAYKKLMVNGIEENPEYVKLMEFYYSRVGLSFSTDDGLYDFASIVNLYKDGNSGKFVKLYDYLDKLPEFQGKEKTNTTYNGKIPAENLAKVNISGSANDKRMIPAAAAAVTKIAEELKNTFNYTLTTSSIFRNLEKQKELKETDPDRAATPGFSPHGLGIAIDFDGFRNNTIDLANISGVNITTTGDGVSGLALIRAFSTRYKLVTAVAAKYGLFNPHRLSDRQGLDELWHFEYHADFDGCSGEEPELAANNEPLVVDIQNDNSRNLSSNSANQNLRPGQNYNDVRDFDYVTGRLNYASDTRFTTLNAPVSSKVIYVTNETAQAFIEMRNAAAQDGISLQAISGGRNFYEQKRIWERKFNANKKGGLSDLDNAMRIIEFSYMPGASRHHWGTDIDINNLDNEYFESGRGLDEYNWLRENAETFGFCQIYNSKAFRTGYNEEKWHWSYLPESTKFLNTYNRLVKDSDIKGFSGSETAQDLDIVRDYMNGINQDCK